MMKITGLIFLTISLFAINAKAQSNGAVGQIKDAVAMLEKNASLKVLMSKDDQKFDVEKSRSITKSFSLNKNDKVLLSNQFGGITVKTWGKNEVRLDAEIKAFGNSDAEAAEQLENVSITGIKDGDLASFKTTLGEIKSRNRRRNGNQVKIFYTVFMPATNPITATQQYGNVLLPDFSGPTSIKVQYGDLNAGDLSNANNYISVQYGKATLGDVNVAKIKHRYGGDLTIKAINILELNSQYAKVVIGTINREAIIDQQYGGGVNIASVKNLQLKSQYSNVKIAKIVGNVQAKLQYSGLIMDNITADCKKLELSADYADVSLGFASNFTADFNLGVDYGGFKYGGNVSSVKSTGNDSGNSKKYAGKIGGGGNAAIDIKVTYGSVKFN